MKNIETKYPTPLTVGEMYESWGAEFGLHLLAGRKGFLRIIGGERVHKPGLRMVETDIELEDGRIQALGSTELAYMAKLSEPAHSILCEVLTHQNVPCYIITTDLDASLDMVEIFEEHDMPLFVTKENTERLMELLSARMLYRLAPFVTIHGLLMDIRGLGVLILGKSGIGKSESALDLILKGEKLVADDVVIVRRMGEGRLVGTSPDTIRHLMEVRGVGIINVRDMFGPASVLEARDVELIIELVDQDDEDEIDRTGLAQKHTEIIGIGLPHCLLPVRRGQNMSTIVEVAVRNQILKASGSTLGGDIEVIFEPSGKTSPAQ